VPSYGRQEFKWGDAAEAMLLSGAAGAAFSTLCNRALGDKWGCFGLGFTATVFFGAAIHSLNEAEYGQRRCSSFAGIAAGSLIGPGLAIALDF